MFTRNNKKDPVSTPRRRQADTAIERPSSTDVSDRYAFRRNRTITGSTSPSIASGAELRAEVQSPRAHAHHLTRVRRHLSLYFALVALSALGLYILLYQVVATASFRVTGIDSLDPADSLAYSSVLEDYYAARPVERLRFMLNTNDLTSHVQATRPEVESVRLEPSGLGEAVVVIQPRDAIARWRVDGTNKYVDSEGTVFTKNYGEIPQLQIVDNSGIRTDSVRQIASNRFLGFIGRVIAASDTNGIAVTKVTIPALTTRQVAVSLEGKKTEYKLSIDRPVGQQVEDVTRLNRYFAANGLLPEYADVRIQGKAFYK